MSDKGKDIGGLSPSSIRDYLATLTKKERQGWLQSNWDKMDAGQRDAAAYVFSTGVGLQGGTTTEEIDFIDSRASEYNLDNGEQLVRIDLAAVAKQRATNAAAGQATSADLDGDGVPRPDEQALLDAARLPAAQEVADQNGVPVGVTTQNQDPLFGAGTPQPDWIKNLYGAQLTDRQVQELMDSYNEAHPNDRVGTADQLFAKLQSPANPDNKELVEATIGGRDPVVTQSWNVFDQHGASRSVRMSADQVNAAMTAFGADLTSLGKIVRLASRSGLIDSEGNVEWQILAGLAKATGRVKPQEKPTDFMTSGISKDTRTFPGLQTDIIDGGNMSILAAKYREGLDRYGDPALAYLHALNPALAQQLSVTKGDKLTREQKVAATTLFEKGGISGQLLSDLGFARANSFNQTANALLDAGYYENGSPGGNGTPGNQVTTRDPAAVRQKAKETWQTMFFTDPTEQQLQGFISQMDAAYQAQSASTTDITQGVELDARLQAYAESQPIYKELYGNKPKGMSDADYRVQFQAGAQGLLGNETADPNTLKSGMRTGQYQTTVGAVAGSAKAFGNSTFLGRLAQAAQVVNAST